MSEWALLQNYLVVGALLFGLGLVGLLVRRNLIVMFLCAEMMLQAVSLSLVAWGRYHGDWGGQIFVVFMIAVAACEAAIALALILMLAKQTGSLDVAGWQDLREEGQAPFVDRGLPGHTAGTQEWPSLTPAGIEPQADEDESSHRSQI